MKKKPKSKQHSVFVAVGSNIEPQENIAQALKLLRQHPSIEVDKISKLITTKPYGYLPQDDFLNGIIKARTNLSPFALLKSLQAIENTLLRKRTIKNGPRTIDLDIILYGNKRIRHAILDIPHARAYERDFVLQPLKAFLGKSTLKRISDAP